MLIQAGCLHPVHKSQQTPCPALPSRSARVPVSTLCSLQIAVPYDWRLPIPLMQKRDGFYTRLKREVELQHQLSEGIKAILVSHSYGATVTTTFLHWVRLCCSISLFKLGREPLSVWVDTVWVDTAVCTGLYAV